MNKKFVCLLLSVCMLCGMCTGVSAGSIFADMDDDSAYSSQANLLKTLGILSGDGDGSLRPYDSLTRAEFAKLAVCILDKQKEAVSNSGASAYIDLAPNHWAIKYINYVSKNSIILGYPDGSFHPDENISFAQAVTITLRLLGYTTDDVGDFWPDNYIQKASAMNLTESMHYSSDDAITRADMVLLLGRALETDMKSSTPASKKTLLDNFGYTVIDETTIVSSQANDKSLAADRIKTSDATYKTLTNDVFGMVGGTAKLYLDNEKRIILALPIEQNSYTLTIQKSLGDGEYTCISSPDGEFDYTFDENLTMYYEGKTGSYSTMEKYLEPGATVTFHGKYDGIWEYAMLEKAAKITPVIATRDVQSGEASIGGIAITNSDTLRIYRDGYSASLSDIKRNDVIYYNPATNIMDVYIDKVTGTYDKALPNKAHVTSLELGGKTFEIETREATAKLDETAGSFKINDRITLLLGKDGAVAGVVNLANDSSLDYAVLVSTSSQMSEEDDDKGKSIMKVKVMQTDGETYEYKAVKDYGDYIGNLVKMSFTDGVATLQKVGTSSITGAVDTSAKMIGSHSIAEGAALFDLSSSDGSEAVVTKIEFDDIKSTTLYEEDVISYAVTTSFGDIGVILFNNITNSDTQYGILTERKVVDGKSSISGTYTVDVKGVETTYSNNSAYSAYVGTPVKIAASGKTLNSLQPLVKVAEASSVDAIDYNRIKVGGQIYNMDENVVIYRQNSTTFKYVTASQSDILASNIMSVQLWADNSVASGGIVRIIKVNYAAN